MNCRECEHDIQELLNPDALPAQVAMLRGHIEHCTACAALYHELQQVEKVFARTQTLEPPPDLWSRIQSKLSAKPATNDRLNTGWWNGLLGPRLRWAGPLAIAIILALSAGVGIYQHKAQRLQQERLAQIDRAERELIPANDRNPFAVVATQDPDVNPFRRTDWKSERNPFKQP